MAMSRDTVDLVNGGYKKILETVKDVGELVLMLAYQFIAPFVFHKKFSYLAFMPMVCFPMCMIIFLRLRNERTKAALSKRNVTMDKMIDSVDDTVSNYHIIADYQKRGAFIDRFESDIKEFNFANRMAGLMLLNNAYFAMLLSEICVAAWIFVGGAMVLKSQMSLGMFLANINIFRKIGAAWGNLYDVFLSIMTIFPALETITTNLNLPIEVPTQKALSRKRRRETIAIRTELDKQPSSIVAIDRMPIVVGNIPFVYKTKGPGGVMMVTKLNVSGTVKAYQGELVLLTGPSGGGKSSLLKIIGGNILLTPEDLHGDASFFLPSHLRALHVHTPQFFEDTLLANLTFGVNHGDSDGRLDRVTSICKKLGIHANVIEHIALGDSQQWHDVLSASQCQLISIARALIANPEVLCMHKPTEHFNEAQAHLVTKTLREFVSHRGLLQTDSPTMRRPRTLIMTSTRRSNFSEANRIFHVSKVQGIWEVPASQWENVEIEAAHSSGYGDTEVI